MNGSSSENTNALNSSNKKLTFYHPLCELNLTQFQITESNHDILLKRGDQEIRILTYNIFLRSLVKNNESDWKEERLDDFCRLLHNYDIICLQEMFGTFNSRKQSLIRAATIAGFFFFVDTASPDFLSKYLADGGLIILSRFPIVAHAYHKFRYGVVADSLAEKGLIYAKIAIKDSYLHIFTSHLQASYFDSGETNFIASFRTRMDQLNHINYLMSEILAKEYDKRSDKILLVGDLNVDALGYAYKQLISERCNQMVQTEYSDMINILNNRGLKVIDCFYQNYNLHPITYGDINEDNSPRETILTHLEDLGARQSLDYIFECFYDEDENDPKKKKLTLDKTINVEKFFVKELINNGENLDTYTRKYLQLSDHYGLSCKLIYKEDKNYNNTDVILDIKKVNNDTYLLVKEKEEENEIEDESNEESRSLMNR